MRFVQAVNIRRVDDFCLCPTQAITLKGTYPCSDHHLLQFIENTIKNIAVQKAIFVSEFAMLFRVTLLRRIDDFRLIQFQV